MTLEPILPYLDLASPFPWIGLLLACIASQITGMIKGPQKGRSEKTMEAYREVGSELFYVFLPFVFYSGLTVVDGSFVEFLSGTELPMASTIMLGMLILSINKGIEAAGEHYETWRFNLLRRIAVGLMIVCLFLVAWLFHQDKLWPWLSVINLSIVFLVICFAFGVIGAINRMIKAPEEVGLKPSRQ